MVGIAGSTGAVLERSLNRMKQLVDRSIGEIRKTNSSQVPLRNIRLIDIFGEVEAVVMTQAESKQVQLIIDIDPFAEVCTDEEDLFCALSNVIQNAVKFTKPGGKVWVKSMHKSDCEVIEVEDECGGMLENKMEEIFTSFVQAGENKSGLGLGLALARRGIRTHGGDITVKNISGRGCIFSIALPQSQPISQQKQG